MQCFRTKQKSNWKPIDTVDTSKMRITRMKVKTYLYKSARKRRGLKQRDTAGRKKNDG